MWVKKGSADQLPDRVSEVLELLTSVLRQRTQPPAVHFRNQDTCTVKCLIGEDLTRSYQSTHVGPLRGTSEDWEPQEPLTAVSKNDRNV
jgi:hypothetical protein